MIKNFKHKGLKNFYETGSKKGIQPDHAKKLSHILDMLDTADLIEDLNAPSFKLHQLTGNEKGIWSIWVNGNYRVTFSLENGEADIIDYRDYH